MFLCRLPISLFHLSTPLPVTSPSQISSRGTNLHLSSLAIIAGCLHSFAIFIPGRAQAFRIRNYGSSRVVPRPSYQSNRINSIQSLGTKARIRTESFLLDEVELIDDLGSKKSLVGVEEGKAEGRIVVERVWSQK
jgi:hypothetical protein